MDKKFIITRFEQYMNENSTTENTYGIGKIGNRKVNVSFDIYYDDDALVIKSSYRNEPIIMEIVKISERYFECWGEPFATSESEAIHKGISKILEALFEL